MTLNRGFANQRSTLVGITLPEPREAAKNETKPPIEPKTITLRLVLERGEEQLQVEAVLPLGDMELPVENFDLIYLRPAFEQLREQFHAEKPTGN